MLYNAKHTKKLKCELLAVGEKGTKNGELLTRGEKRGHILIHTAQFSGPHKPPKTKYFFYKTTDAYLQNENKVLPSKIK